MHRNNLREMLERYAPTDVDEILYKTRMLNFLNAYENCFERSLAVGYSTGSCWLVNPDDTKFLLTLHKKVELWLQPGGHADVNNDIAHVTLKEGYEESELKHIELASSGIFDIDIHLFSSRKKEISDHFHYDVRFLLRASDENIKISDEADDLRWFSKLPEENLGGGVIRMYRKWKEIVCPTNIEFE